MGLFYPELAVRMNKNGYAKIHCTVTIAGNITNCLVLEESPAGYGFGKATILVMSRTGLMNPARRDGAPLPGEVTIPLHWHLNR